MKRRHAPEHENHERWLVSYADFITLLFAFFVVMFASTQADKAKARAVSESVRDALEQGQFRSVLATVLGKGRHENDRTAADPRVGAKASGAGLKVLDKDVGSPKSGQETPPPADLVKSAQTLESALAEELKKGKVAIGLEPRGLVISLREAGFFASGDDIVSPSSLPALAKIASVVAALPNPVRLEGHTDSLPIHNSRFRSNWELSTARAIATLELLAGRYQIPRARMAVAGYAENVPADSNDSEAGRAHNRRVDIVLLTAEGLRWEPAAGAAANVKDKQK
ncbi:MAG TPA: flagellar motor protein MotB [Bryobacteraceae bacterium]|nr:flagellar motor protein MotB [Bryobacteraceae bacterium]